MKEEQTWFSHKGCTELTIQKYKSISEHEIVASTKITNETIIEHIMEKIEGLPVEGPLMVEWGPNAEYMELTFSCDKGSQKIEIYGQRFKTPSTGFIVGDEEEAEKNIYKEIIEQLEQS